MPLQTKLTAIPISSSDESSSDDDEYNSDNAANALRRYGNFTDKSKEEVSKDLEEKIVAVWDFDQTLSLIHVHLMVTLIDGFAKKPAFSLSASDPGPRLLPPSASERLASSYDLILTSMADITIEDEQKEEKEKIEANTLPLQTKLTAIPISSSDESSSDDDEYNSDNAANALRRYGNFYR